MRPVLRLPRVHRTEHHGVRDFAVPDLEPTLEGAQKPIAIGPRIFDLQSSKQLTASSPRLRSEPCVQLLSDLRQRGPVAGAPAFVSVWVAQSAAPRRLSMRCEGPPRTLRSEARRSILRSTRRSDRLCRRAAAAPSSCRSASEPDRGRRTTRSLGREPLARSSDLPAVVDRGLLEDDSACAPALSRAPSRPV